MSQAFFGTPPQTFTGADLRRSTRIERPVPLLIFGHDETGQEFLERTAATSLNLHGCRYPSRHECMVGEWVTLQIGEPALGETTVTVRAQVKSVHQPKSSRELRQVGVELEAPGNVWSIPAPPADWSNGSSKNANGKNGNGSLSAEATGPGRAPTMEDMPRLAAVPAPVAAGVAPAMETNGAAAKPEVLPLPKPAAAAGPNRVVITPDKLIAGLQAKLQKTAETAVLAAIQNHLEPALKKAIQTIEETREGSIRQVEEASTQQRNTLMHSSRGEMLARIDNRVEEVRGQWESQLEGFKVRSEEIVQRIDRQAAIAKRDLEEAKLLSDKALRELDPKMTTEMELALSRTRNEFDRGAAQAADRHLVRVLDEGQKITREATLKLDATVAEARASIQSAARETLEEFCRQMELHSELTLSDTSQRITSSLAALDAENRAACEARKLSLEDEVKRTGENITDQFRQSLRAFFYSCLVAAVGAVEQHSQTTKDGLNFDGGPFHLPKP